MKKLNTLFALLFLAGMVVMSGCKDKKEPEEKTEEQKQIEALTGAWTVSSVSLDNSDITSDWTSFTVTFGGDKTYTSANSNNSNVWPASGTYDFAVSGSTVDVNTMLRSGNGTDLEIALTVSENSLTMSFDYDTDIHGRLKGTDGAWIFVMSK